LKCQYLFSFLDACRSKNEKRVEEEIRQLRKAILFQGIPSSISELDDEDDIPLQERVTVTLRGKVWKALMGLNSVDSGLYISLLEKGK
jgi:hypothetical protein